jgi:hypothetical protein
MEFLEKASLQANPFNNELYLLLRQAKLEVTDLLDLKQEILPQVKNKRPDNLQEVLIKELSDMEEAIKLAADKIGVSLLIVSLINL